MEAHSGRTDRAKASSEGIRAFQTDQTALIQRLENWKRLRAPG